MKIARKRAERSFTGVVSQDPLLDPEDPFGGAISTGTAFSGSYTFDSDTPDAAPGPAVGSYTSAGGTLNVTIGGQLFTAADLLNIGVQNSANDFYTVFAQHTGSDPFDISLLLQDLDGTALSGSALLTNAPPLALFEVATLFLNGSIGGNQVQIDGVLTSLTCTAGCVPGGETGSPVPVPEPATLTVIGLGIGIGLGSRRRRYWSWR